MKAKQKKQLMYVGLAVAAGAGIYFLSKGSAADPARVNALRSFISKVFHQFGWDTLENVTFIQQLPSNEVELTASFLSNFANWQPGQPVTYQVPTVQQWAVFDKYGWWQDLKA